MLAVFIYYSRSEQENQGHPAKLQHHPGPALHWQLQTLASPNYPPQRGQPSEPPSATYHPTPRSANLRPSGCVSRGKHTYHLSGFLISPTTKWQTPLFSPLCWLFIISSFAFPCRPLFSEFSPCCVRLSPHCWPTVCLATHCYVLFYYLGSYPDRVIHF